MTLAESHRSNIVQHHMWASSAASPVTIVACSMGGLSTGSATANPVLPRACKLSKVGICSITAADTNPGNWTLRIRKNESGSDTATASFNVTTSLTKVATFWSTEAVWQAGESFQVQADGPGKAGLLLHIIIEFELI